VTLAPAGDYEKYFGEADPRFNFSVDGLQFEESPSVISGSVTRTAGENAGVYRLNGSGLYAGENYTVVIEDPSAVLRINPAAPSFAGAIPAASAITYGERLSASKLTPHPSFLIAGSYTWETPAVSPSVYDGESTTFVVIFKPDSTNYASARVRVSVRVLPVEVAVSFFGERSVIYTGSAVTPIRAEVNGEFRYLKVDIRYPIQAINVGTYTASAELANRNYIITGANSASFEVTPKTLTVGFIGLTVMPSVLLSPEFTYEGFASSDTENNALSAKPTLGKAPNAAGVYKLKASGAEGRNYTIVYKEGTVTVMSAVLTLDNGAEITGGFSADAKLKTAEAEADGKKFAGAKAALDTLAKDNFGYRFKKVETVIEFSLEEGSFAGGAVTVKLPLYGANISGSTAFLFIDSKGNAVMLEDYTVTGDFITFTAQDLGRLAVLGSYTPTWVLIAGGLAAAAAVAAVLVFVVRKRRDRLEFGARDR